MHIRFLGGDFCWGKGISAHERAMFYLFWLQILPYYSSVSQSQEELCHSFGPYLNYQKQPGKKLISHAREVPRNTWQISVPISGGTVKPHRHLRLVFHKPKYAFQDSCCELKRHPKAPSSLPTSPFSLPCKSGVG